MTEQKTTANQTQAKKNPTEQMNDVAQIGRKAFMAYVEAGQLAASHMDKLVRAQTAHATSFHREAGEAFTAMIDNGIKARETARQAAVELLEASIPAGK